MSNPPSRDLSPPRWLERLLLLVVKKRERESISGDLLEEYREVILPARGSWRANLWYLKQTLSLISNVAFGFTAGAILGLTNLISTAIAPLAEDTPFRVAVFFGVIMLVWAFSGFLAHRRTRRFIESAKAGATVGGISLGLFHLAAMLRLNIFLADVSRRSDWQGLILNFQQSGFESLRAYANYTYLHELGFVVLLGVLVGALCGILGGTASFSVQCTTKTLRHS